MVDFIQVNYRHIRLGAPLIDEILHWLIVTCGRRFTSCYRTNHIHFLIKTD